MIPLVTGETMATIDRRAIVECGIPGSELMENAGREGANFILHHFDSEGCSRKNTRIAVVSGKGNNGGDGFVVSRFLMEAGLAVTHFAAVDTQELSPEVREKAELFMKEGGEVRTIFDRESLSLFADYGEKCDSIVDALFGTGLRREVLGLYRDIIKTINSLEVTVFSLDIPSGISATSGKILGEAVYADYTLTFAFLKQGQVLFPGSSHCGEIHRVDIGIPEKAFSETYFDCFKITAKSVSRMLPVRANDFHKGKAGKTYIVGGSRGMTGAVVMSSEGALAAGSGLIYAVIPESLNPILEIKLTEEMTCPVEDGGLGVHSPEGAREVTSLITKADSVALGPGLSMEDRAGKFLFTLIPEIKKPLVIDADGLNWIARRKELLKGLSCHTVVTPHEMEMSRLLGTSLEDVKNDRIGSARAFATTWGVTTVLKGFRTVIALPEGTVYLNPTGNPYMATGGMGDVLTGIIASLLGQGLSPENAAVAGVYLHGLTGDIIQENFPHSPIAPRHIVSYYPEAIRRITHSSDELS